MNCDHCLKDFNDSMLGLVEKTFHELIHHDEKEINGHTIEENISICEPGGRGLNPDYVDNSDNYERIDDVLRELTHKFSVKYYD